MIDLKGNLLEEVEMGMEENKGEILIEEERLIFKEGEMKIPLHKGMEFVIEIVMLIKIVGSRERRNANIATNLGLSRKNVNSIIINKQIYTKSKNVMGTCFMVVTLHQNKRMMFRFLIVHVAIM